VGEAYGWFLFVLSRDDGGNYLKDSKPARVLAANFLFTLSELQIQ